MSEPGALEGVGFWPRALARIIDMAVHQIVGAGSGILLGIMLAIIAALAGVPFEVIAARMQGENLAALLLGVLGYTVLGAVCEAGHGSTPGKMLLGMVVVQEDGTPCRWRPALIRSAAYFVDSLVFGLVGYLAMKDNRMQRHGDQWADTVVCKRSTLAPEQLRGAGRFWAVLLLAAMADAVFVVTAITIMVIF